MGGQTDAMKTYRQYQQEIPAGGGYKPMTPEEAATRKQLAQQGMSGAPNQSASDYLEKLKTFGMEFIQDKSPNAFGRQASPAPTPETQNK